MILLVFFALHLAAQQEKRRAETFGQTGETLGMTFLFHNGQRVEPNEI